MPPTSRNPLKSDLLLPFNLLTDVRYAAHVYQTGTAAEEVSSGSARVLYFLFKIPWVWFKFELEFEFCFPGGFFRLSFVLQYEHRRFVVRADTDTIPTQSSNTNLFLSYLQMSSMRVPIPRTYVYQVGRAASAAAPLHVRYFPSLNPWFCFEFSVSGGRKRDV